MNWLRELEKPTLNVNGEFWDVLFVHPFHPALQRLDGTYSIGACNDNVKCIFINCELNDYYLKRVLLHEICHAIVFSYNLSISYRTEEMLSDLIATYG